MVWLESGVCDDWAAVTVTDGKVPGLKFCKAAASLGATLRAHS